MNVEKHKEFLRYLESLLLELSWMAEARKLWFIAYLLMMAQAETADVLAEHRPDDGEMKRVRTTGFRETA